LKVVGNKGFEIEREFHNSLEFIFPGNKFCLAGFGTLDFPGCQRVTEPVSYLFFINPNTKSERMLQINMSISGYPKLGLNNFLANHELGQQCQKLVQNCSKMHNFPIYNQIWKLIIWKTDR
jgi:hypothetical protein